MALVLDSKFSTLFDMASFEMTASHSFLTHKATEMS